MLILADYGYGLDVCAAHRTCQACNISLLPVLWPRSASCTVHVVVVVVVVAAAVVVVVAAAAAVVVFIVVVLNPGLAHGKGGPRGIPSAGDSLGELEGFCKLQQ